MTVKAFLLPQIRALADLYDLTVVANLQDQNDLKQYLPESVHLINIPIQRKINLFGDLKALFQLSHFFYKSNFTLVHSVSPKAGLLAMLSSWLVRVPIRLHTFTGQVWATKQGVARFVLKGFDKLIALMATKILIDSHSQREFLIQNRIVKDSNSLVLGAGSISGVDLGRFKINSVARKEIRKKLNTSETSIVILFLGRLKKEKGIIELVEAFSAIHIKIPDTELWLVGPDEDQLQSKLKQTKGIKFVSFTREPEKYMASADIFCLPSYREGFGSVVIEAAACGVPSIGSNIYGLNDAISNGKTGILVSARSTSELEVAINKLVVDDALREKMACAAVHRAKNKFSQCYLIDELMALYKRALEDLNGKYE